jgi:hypothetical protein
MTLPKPRDALFDVGYDIADGAEIRLTQMMRKFSKQWFYRWAVSVQQRGDIAFVQVDARKIALPVQ